MLLLMSRQLPARSKLLIMLSIVAVVTSRPKSVRSIACIIIHTNHHDENASLKRLSDNDDTANDFPNLNRLIDKSCFRAVELLLTAPNEYTCLHYRLHIFLNIPPHRQLVHPKDVFLIHR